MRKKKKREKKGTFFDFQLKISVTSDVASDCYSKKVPFKPSSFDHKNLETLNNMVICFIFTDAEGTITNVCI